MVEILIILFAAVVAVLLFSRIGFGAVLGYLVAGVVIGPSLLGLITDAENIRHVGEFGVVFLLFLIGIEIKPQRLWVMRKMVFGLGGAQVLLTGLLLGLGVHFFLDLETSTSIIVGLGLALSSTAFAIQAMAEKNQLITNWGRHSFSILLLQDLAVVPLMVLVPLLAADTFNLTSSMGLAVLESIAIFVAVLVIGKYAINPVLRIIASSKSKEVFAATALLLVLGFATIMEVAGLSMAMGAFVAGILLSESEFRHQVEADIEPFRGLLLGLFFISVGMSVELDIVFENLSLVIIGTIALIILKLSVIFVIVKAGKLNLGESLKSSFLLCQAGEFGFVLFSLADKHGVLPHGFLAPLISVIVLSMAITPVMIIASEKLSKMLSSPEKINNDHSHDPADDIIIIAGYGRVGRTIGKMLSSLERKWVAVDLNVDKITNGRSKGHKIYYGDVAQEKVLHAVGAPKAQLIILTVDNIQATEKSIRVVKRHYPDLPIVVRAHDLDVCEKFKALGATYVVPEVVESSIRLGLSATEAMGIDAQDIRQMLDTLRADDYAEMKEISAD